MEKREGYKKTKIGWIPEEWEAKTLGTIGEFLKGKGIAKKDLIEYGVPCVRYGEIYTVHHWVLKKFYSFISSETASQSTKIVKGDILFAGSGETVEEIGKAVAYLEDEEAYAGGDTIILRPDNVHSAFLSACLDTEIANTQKRKLGQGHSVVHIYPAGLKKLLVPYPPLPEQKKIASILTTVDDKISSIEHQIQQTEQLKKGLMEKLLTEGIGHTEFKETKIGRIPKGWDVAYLDDCCEAIQDGTHFSPKSKTGPFMYLTSKNIRFGYLDLLDVQYISEEDHVGIFKRCPVQYRDILLTKDGANTGNVALNTLTEPFSLLSSVAFIRSNTRLAVNLFILQYFLSPKGQKMIKDGMAGQAITRITLTKLKAFKIPVPPLEEQKQIATILSTVDDKIEVLNQKKTQYQTLKKGLSQQLLTGQMRVKI